MSTIAFIPVRGGSKSIPLKNIKNFCGKPLVFWNIQALHHCAQVDQIVVATDSDEIEQVVKGFNLDKVCVYRRSSENATDLASTESVMLEYLNKKSIASDTIFMLVQATSPLTETRHFDEALTLYATGQYDSLLTCVRHYRFFWNADGTSKNYDYKNRPRRQDFAGELMENGAFYINQAANIRTSGNRLSGHIGIYEMPEYTATEIDEPDDWMVLEKLMQKHVLSQRPQSKKNIRLFISDVDGVLTDGGMYYSENGDELKKFNTRDGMGFQLLQEKGIQTAIITSEKTQITEKRAQKLKVDYLIQGAAFQGKFQAALEICRKNSISMDEVAYIGDDINCAEILQQVGLKACPQDALPSIKAIEGILIMPQKGGEGCVREFVQHILNHNV